VTPKPVQELSRDYGDECLELYCCFLTLLRLFFKLDCSHENYSAGVSYLSLDDERYFKPGEKYDGIGCQVCQVAFSANATNSNYKKVETRCPAYVCKNNTRGCLHVICDLCMKKKVADGSRKSGAPRLLRSRLSKTS
jgi:hypothetical protein